MTSYIFMLNAYPTHTSSHHYQFDMTESLPRESAYRWRTPDIRARTDTDARSHGSGGEGKKSPPRRQNYCLGTRGLVGPLKGGLKSQDLLRSGVRLCRFKVCLECSFSKILHRSTVYLESLESLIRQRKGA